LTDVVNKWPAYSKWSFKFFRDVLGKREFQAESLSLSFEEYYRYMTTCNEESPLYLFDKNFAKETGLKKYFVPPACFQDLFNVLETRPDFQWLIVGPKRSGSTFHIDPNSTSAWNAVIKGRKKWVLYPPNQSPPGVYAHDNGSNVTSPVSLAEWYLNFYSPNNMKGAIECVCEEGELLYVPNRWWHSVMNIEGLKAYNVDSIAITQNFVDEHNLPNVIDFLTNKPDQISGYDGDLLKDFLAGLEKHEKKMHSIATKPKEKTLWQRMNEQQADDQPSTAFTFAFES
jgi:Cupin-like domain